MRYKNILALDPSGNWKEGKGTTGICIRNARTGHMEVCTIKATDFPSRAAYWDAHVDFISKAKLKYRKNLAVVTEDYLLYASKANNQINSKMETPRLLGILEWFCYINDICYFSEPASAVKQRWSNDILKHKNIIKKTRGGYTLNGDKCSGHELDAIRHAIHFDTFVNGKRI